MNPDTEDPAIEPEEHQDVTSTIEPLIAEKPEPEGEPESEAHEIVLEGEAPEAAPKDSTAWARMRKEKRDAEIRAAELERKIRALETSSSVPDPGPEPTLASCEFDEAKFVAARDSWKETVARKRAADAQAAQQAEAQQQHMRSLEEKYRASKTELSKHVPDYAEAEAAVIAAMSPAHQDALLKATDDAAKVVAYIGKHPKLLEELAKETDRDRFIAKLSKLEVKLIMKKTGTQAPAPEKPVRGTGAVSPGDSTENKLRAQAEKTGDYTALQAYKRKQREQQQRR